MRHLLEYTAAATARGLAAAGVLCAVAMMLLVTSDVIARYGFSRPSMWADEIASYLLVAIVFFGLAQNLRQGNHIRIDVITVLLPPRTRLLLQVLAYAAGVVFSAILVAGTWTRFDNFWSRGTTSDSVLMTPLWIPMLPVVVGAVALGLVAAAGFTTHLHALVSGREPEAGP